MKKSKNLVVSSANLCHSFEVAYCMAYTVLLSRQYQMIHSVCKHHFFSNNNNILHILYVIEEKQRFKELDYYYK